jgi:hypothetical protein
MTNRARVFSSFIQERWFRKSDENEGFNGTLGAGKCGKKYLLIVVSPVKILHIISQTKKHQAKSQRYSRYDRLSGKH